MSVENQKPAGMKAMLDAYSLISRAITFFNEDIRLFKEEMSHMERSGLSIKLMGLTERFNKLEHFVITQFDNFPKETQHSSARFDRIKARFYASRSDISNLRADIKELAQLVRKKELV